MRILVFLKAESMAKTVKKAHGLVRLPNGSLELVPFLTQPQSKNVVNELNIIIVNQQTTNIALRSPQNA